MVKLTQRNVLIKNKYWLYLAILITWQFNTVGKLLHDIHLIYGLQMETTGIWHLTWSVHVTFILVLRCYNTFASQIQSVDNTNKLLNTKGQSNTRNEWSAGRHLQMEFPMTSTSRCTDMYLSLFVVLATWPECMYISPDRYTEAR